MPRGSAACANPPKERGGASPRRKGRAREGSPRKGGARRLAASGRGAARRASRPPRHGLAFGRVTRRSGHARGGAAAAVVRAAPPRNFENAELDDGASWARRRGGGGVDDEASRPVDGRAAALPGLAPAGGGRGLPRPTTSVARCRTRGTGTSKNDGRWTYENPRILSFGDEKYFSFQIQGFRIVSYGVSLLI